MSILSQLRSRFNVAVEGWADKPSELVEMVRPSQDPKFGDYQANCAMPLGKRLKKPPIKIAQEIVNRLDVSDICYPPELAGPGFINLRVRDEWLLRELENISLDGGRLGVETTSSPRTFVLDYSSPNVAKPMHVGHIRSTVIGDSLYRLLNFLGHRTISDNHLGDWGTQFGMILYGYRHFLKEMAYQEDPVKELSRLYRQVNQLASRDPEIAREVLVETEKLHRGDEENRKRWGQFLPPCQQAIQKIYNRLGVSFDHVLGESFYHDRLPQVVDQLRAHGLTTVSDGALCVFLEGQSAPFIIRKRDGAFLYATTDLATIQYRIQRFRPDAILYVVDHRQSEHFQKLFATTKLWGYRDVELRHLSFGTVLGEDGKPFKTRSGDVVGLAELLDEAVHRALKIVSANDDLKAVSELSLDERRQVAEVVGIGALKYADLSQNRTSDYVFSYDKMLAMKGNTASYMQYSYARVQSIFLKGRVSSDQLRQGTGKLSFQQPEERALGLELLRFSEGIERAAVEYRPNHLTAYLFGLASRYAEFFEDCPVLQAETDAGRISRLVLCSLTARTLELGLRLLGIGVVEKM